MRKLLFVLAFAWICVGVAGVEDADAGIIFTRILAGHPACEGPDPPTWCETGGHCTWCLWDPDRSMIAWEIAQVFGARTGGAVCGTPLVSGDPDDWELGR